MENNANTQRDQYVGGFLVRLMRKDSPRTAALSGAQQALARTQQLAINDYAQTYFSTTTDSAKQISHMLPLSLRANRITKRALRAAYRKFHRKREDSTALAAIFVLEIVLEQRCLFVLRKV